MAKMPAGLARYQAAKKAGKTPPKAKVKKPFSFKGKKK